MWIELENTGRDHAKINLDRVNYVRWTGAGQLQVNFASGEQEPLIVRGNDAERVWRALPSVKESPATD